MPSDSAQISLDLMHAPVIRTLVTLGFVLAFTHPCRSQIGETKDELVRRYGSCSPNPARGQLGPNVYDSVLDVGEDCTFQHNQLHITALFKAGKALAFQYRKEDTFWHSLLHAKVSPYLEISDEDLSAILRLAVPHANWVLISADAHVRRWRTSDSSAFAYYFAGGHSELHALLVQTAAVDAIYKKVEKE